MSRSGAGQTPGLVHRLASRPAGQVGLALAAVIAVIAVFGPLVASNPNLTDYAHQLSAPGHLHWLGTDPAGRDELARSVAGLRTSVEAALIVFALTSAVGVVLGGLAGYCGGIVDIVISRAIDVLLGLPSLIVALAIVGALGAGYWNLVAAISFSGWAYLARITRSHVLGSRSRLDVIAARMAGVGEVGNLAAHVLPGALANVLVAATSTFAEVILSLAGLSFLGLGAQPPTAELGQMLSDSRGDLAGAPWLVVGPTLGIVLSVAAATLLSDALRDAVDVRFSPTRARRRRPAPPGSAIPPASPARRVPSALAIDDLHVVYPDGGHAVRGVDLVVAGGDCVALVGESGCGKTTLARAVLGLLPSGSTVSGSLRVGDTDVLSLSESELRRVRGLMVGYVAEDPFVACDPLQSVQRHVAEAWRAQGQKVSPSKIAGRVGRLGVDDSADRLRQRPYQWSGGMLQRATMVAANAHQPAITIADEPTSALDAELANDVLGALRAASRSVVLITHDLRLVSDHAERVAVMYAGRIVEQGPTHEVVNRPRHPYTKALLAASPLRGGGSDRAPLPATLAGAPPALSGRLPSGCVFAPRCPLRQPICTEREPPSVEGVACWVHPES